MTPEGTKKFQSDERLLTMLGSILSTEILLSWIEMFMVSWASYESEV